MRTGIIGAGGIAHAHSNNLAELEKVSITAVADIDQQKAIDLAAQWGARAVTDYREFLDEVDAVYVCTPPTIHRQQVEIVAEAGVPIYCEKPLTNSYKTALELVKEISNP